MTKTLSMSMPSHVASTTVLATQNFKTEAPSWIVGSEPTNLFSYDSANVPKSPSFNDIFRIPNLGGVIHNWLFTRPSVEVIGEDAFEKCTAESNTMVRIDRVTPDQTLLVTPTVSSHLLLVPCTTLNGFTLGLSYIDVTYERSANTVDHRVPTLKLGRFVIDNATGEFFLTGWSSHNSMVIDWTQSILKCERVREIILFEAPPNGQMPTTTLLRNSFFQRRHCALCGIGDSLNTLPPPCCAIDTRSSQQHVHTSLTVTNVGSLFRRFRGSYCGIALKVPYGSDGQPILRQLVPIVTDSRYGLDAVRTSFQKSLLRNVDIIVGGASTDGFFGIHPTSSAKVFLLKADHHPILVDCTVQSDKTVEKSVASSSVSSVDSPRLRGVQRKRRQRRKKGEDRSDESKVSGKRSRAEDSLDRESILHKRKVRNRLSAQRSNLLRKMTLAAKVTDLDNLKAEVPILSQRLSELKRENRYLRFQLYGSGNGWEEWDGWHGCKEPIYDLMNDGASSVCKSSVDPAINVHIDCTDLGLGIATDADILPLEMIDQFDSDSFQFDETPVAPNPLFTESEEYSNFVKRRVFS